MFKSKLSGILKNVLGNKDRKNLRQQLIKAFPSHDISNLENLFLPEHVYVYREATSKSVIYVVNGDPLAFDREGTLFPTVYALAVIPNLLPTFVVHHSAVPYILGGADVMLPSIVRPVSTECYGSLYVNKPMSVCVYGNPVPFCVGLCLVTEESFQMQKGKALKVLHVYNDNLWGLGSQMKPNDGFFDDRVHALSKAKDDSVSPDTSDNVERSEEMHNTMQYDAECDSDSDVSTRQDVPCKGVSAVQDGLTIENESDGNTKQERVTGHVSKKSAIESSKKPLTSNSSKHTSESTKPAASMLKNVDVDSKDQPKQTDNFEDSVIQENNKTNISASTLDRFLELLLLHVLHTNISENSLPIPVSAVFSKMYQSISDIVSHPQCIELAAQEPDGHILLTPSAIYPLDMKKSSYKKLSKFFQHYAKQDLLVIKKLRGEELVFSVKREHPLYKKGYRRAEIITSSSKTQESQEAGSKKKHGETPCNDEDFEIIQCYQAKHPAAIEILQSVSPSVEGGYYTESQCEKAVLDYCERNGLIDFKEEACAIIDPLLAQFCLTKKERKDTVNEKSIFTNQEKYMPLTDVSQKFMGCLQVFHGVRKPGQKSMRMLKDKLQPIQIFVETRQRRKHITYIVNAASFQVDEKVLAEILQKSLAASASLVQIPGTTKKGLMVQGSFSNEVRQILVNQFQIPNHFIQIDS